MSTSLSIIGHVCHDIVEDGHSLGGSASFASILARSLGHQPEVLTSFGDDFAYGALFEERGIHLHNQRAKTTTIFDNQNHGDTRKQQLKARANSLIIDPTFVNDMDIIFLCPIADEVEIVSLKPKPDALVVGLIQGWMRDCQNLGPIIPKELDLQLLTSLDIAICSEEDLKPYSQTYLEALIQSHDHLVVTLGSKGVTIYEGKHSSFFPSYNTIPVDSTGAGDIFGMAYTLSYHREKDIIKAASFAHAAASLSIEGHGIEAIPTLEEIKERQEAYQNDYL